MGMHWCILWLLVSVAIGKLDFDIHARQAVHDISIYLGQSVQVQRRINVDGGRT